MCTEVCEKNMKTGGIFETEMAFLAKKPDSSKTIVILGMCLLLGSRFEV